MVNIALTNHNPSAPDRRVIININTGSCIVDNKREVELQHLISELDFIHPLLMARQISSPDHVFHHQYDDVDGLLYSGIFIYSTLLRVSNPLDCQFHINPSVDFQRIPQAEEIYFSTNPHKVATELIHFRQLEALIADLSGASFQFVENILLEGIFTIHDLPVFIDGDKLYQMEDDMAQLLKFPRNFSRFELRYIDRNMGFGVFSREVIHKGEVISFFGGVKTLQLPKSLNYSFENQFDCLSTSIDARHYGNITRFINHAPNPQVSHPSNQSSLLEANIIAKLHYLNGIEMVVYSATKEVLPGEQLLVDYGKKYFNNFRQLRFKKNGRVVGSNNNFLPIFKSSKISHLRLMAHHGVKKAQQFMLLRIIVITGVIVVAMSLLKIL